MTQDPYVARKIETYRRGVEDWATAQYQSFYNNAPPRPFPAVPVVPTQFDELGNDTGTPLTEPLIRFAQVVIDGMNRLVIVVPINGR